MNKRRPQLKWLLTISVVSICLFDAGVELVGSIGLLNQISVERKVADYLRDHFDPNSGGWIFCDDATVVALSGIPTQRFLTTADAPRDSPKFTAFLKSEKVEYLVFIKRQDSIAARTFPDAESQELNSFELAMHSFTDFWPTDIWLFQRQH